MQTFNGTNLDPRHTRDDALEDPLSLEANNRTVLLPQADGDDRGEDTEDDDDTPSPPASY